MRIDWNHLRPLSGSEREAFEELCCQLAYYEQVPSGSYFERKGKPDGGIECYWKLPNGEEWGWQAKYFRNSPSSGEWEQIDESVKTFLEKHPELTRCIIALPVDLPDPRKNDQASARTKWNTHVKKWQNWAKSRGRRIIIFEYWGEHQFWERLAKQAHQGRFYFWFHKEFFDLDWFKRRLDIAIQNAGERYTPKSNVELPITQLFDGLGRTSAFFTRIQIHYGKLRKAHTDIASDVVPDQVIENHSVLSDKVEQLVRTLLTIEKASVETKLDWETVMQLAAQALKNAWDCHESFQQVKQQALTNRDKFDYPIYHLRQIISTCKRITPQFQRRMFDIG